MHIKTVLASVAASLLLGCADVPRDGAGALDAAAVMRVVEAFRVAIIERDRPAYMGLFFSVKPEEVGWQAVVDDQMLETIRRTRPQAIKARPNNANNFVSLIESVIASTTSQEEKISNVRVYTDGEVASAVFDYVYVSDGQPINRGSEHWQLVRTEGGWKIFSVVYTVRSPSGGA